MRFVLQVATCMLIAAALAPAQLDAQPGPFDRDSRWWIGYTGNAPVQLLGMGTAVTTPRFGGWGLYADVKITHDSPARREFRADLTPNQARDFNDEEFNPRSAWTNINGALIKTVGAELAIYAGGGVGVRTIYIQFLDRTMERHPSGIYWVEEEDQPQSYANLIGGLFFRLGTRFVFQIGAETAPAGFTAGMHVVLK